MFRHQSQTFIRCLSNLQQVSAAPTLSGTFTRSYATKPSPKLLKLLRRKPTVKKSTAATPKTTESATVETTATSVEDTTTLTQSTENPTTKPEGTQFKNKSTLARRRKTHIHLYDQVPYKPKSKPVVGQHKTLFTKYVLPRFIKENCPPMIQKSSLPKGFKQGFLYDGEREYYGTRWMYKVNVVGHNGNVRQLYLFNPLKFQFEDFEHPLSEFEMPEGKPITDHPSIKSFKVQQTLLWQNFQDKLRTERKLESLGAKRSRAPWN